MEKNYITKLVDLPISTAKGLTLLASQTSKYKTKTLMEEILIEYEKRVNHPRSTNYKLLHPKK